MPLYASLNVALGPLAACLPCNIFTHSGEFPPSCPQGNTLISLKSGYTDFKELLFSVNVNPTTSKDKVSIAWPAVSRLMPFALLCAHKPSVPPPDTSDCTSNPPVQ